VRYDEILRLLGEHRAELERFGVKSLSLFGSVVRHQARETSDVDILVEFSESVGLFEFIRLKLYIEKLLGRPVDLVTPDALKPQLRERILKETVRVQ